MTQTNAARQSAGIRSSTRDPIDAVLQALDGYKLRSNGNNRWRACCPAHGGSNPSALSVGIGNSGGVLMRCWQGCEVADIAAALGLSLNDLFPPREPANGHGSPPIRRRHLLTAGQALELLEFETSLALLCAGDLARGEPLDERTRDRLRTSAARIAMLRAEVAA